MGTSKISGSLKESLHQSNDAAWAQAEAIFARFNSGDMTYQEADEELALILKHLERDVTDKIAEEILHKIIVDAFNRFLGANLPPRP